MPWQNNLHHFMAWLEREPVAVARWLNRGAGIAGQHISLIGNLQVPRTTKGEARLGLLSQMCCQHSLALFRLQCCH